MPDLFDRNYLSSLAERYGVHPSRSYGQNFLIERRPVEQAIAAAELKTSDTVVEIGPGFGALTLAIAPAVREVQAYEIEQQLKPYWENVLNQYRNIKLIWGNALQKFSAEQAGYKVVANLPYQITSPILRLFLEQAQPPELLVCMVQKEVAERICAAPGQLSVLAIAVQYYGRPEYIATVPRTAFWPSPKVDSALLKITVRQLPPAERAGTTRFFELVRAGFANRRKTLVNNLKGVFASIVPTERWPLVLAGIGVGPRARAQELSLEQWRALSTYLFGLDVL